MDVGEANRRSRRPACEPGKTSLESRREGPLNFVLFTFNSRAGFASFAFLERQQKFFIIDVGKKGAGMSQMRKGKKSCRNIWQRSISFLFAIVKLVAGRRADFRRLGGGCQVVLRQADEMPCPRLAIGVRLLLRV